MKTQFKNVRQSKQSLVTRTTQSLLMGMMVLAVIFQGSKRVSGQDTHHGVLELLNQLYFKPKNIRRQGELDLGRFAGHPAIDFDAHYQGITRHKNAVYLTSSFPKDRRGGRLLIMDTQAQYIKMPFPLNRVFPKIRLWIQPKGVKEFWDVDRDKNGKPDHLYWHYGGMDTCENILAVAVEYTSKFRVPNTKFDFDNLTGNLKKLYEIDPEHPIFTVEKKVEKGAVIFFDVSDPLNPKYMCNSTLEPDFMTKSGAVGLTRWKDGTWLLAVVGGSSTKVRLFESNNKPGEDFDFQWKATYGDSKAPVYQALSLVTTKEDAVVLFGTYNDEYAVDELANGIPIGVNRVGVTWVYGHKYKGRSWRPVHLDSREFDLWRGYDSIAEASGGFSIGALFVTVVTAPFAAPVLGPAAFIPLASTGITLKEVHKDFEHPNFDGGGGILIDENGNLEIWASAHGRDGSKKRYPRFSTSW